MCGCIDMQENDVKDEFEKQLFENAEKVDSDLTGDASSIKPVEVEDTPEVKKARANVKRIIDEIMARQQAERDATMPDVVAIQSSKEIELGDVKVTDNYLSKFDGTTCYKVKLQNFEGPLDLLLYLIKDDKLGIENIKLASITDQYLNYMKDLDKVDMEKAAEFIEVASTLIEIKSRAMIPQEQEKLKDENDPEWLLLQRLKEYKIFKEASQKMKGQEMANRMFKLPDEKVNDFRNILTQMNIDGLISAFTGLLNKAAIKEVTQEERTIVKDRWTVEEKIFEIRTLLANREKIEFNEMVGGDFTRGEIITLFMAMLELLKLQVINVEQKEMFGEIDIIKGENYNG